MRLTDTQIQLIRNAVYKTAAKTCRIRVFGSRLDENKRGGDIDLLLESPDSIDNPALLAAQLSARVSRVLRGRKIDVLISAPNLAHLPIHDIAFKEGQLI